MKEEIESIFDSLSKGITKRNIETYEFLKDKTFGDFTSGFFSQRDTTPESYFSLIANKLDSFQKGLIASEIGNSRQLIWLYTNQKFIDRQFKQLIKDREGLICSADKSNYIIKSIALFLIDGTKIMQEPKKEEDYFRTTEIFNTHDWVMEFFEALHSLYMGNYGVYLKQLKVTLNKANLLKNQSQEK